MPKAHGASSSEQVSSVAQPSVEEIVDSIGPRLAALRADLGLSLQQMAAIAEVSSASIHKIERGDMVPTITTLLKLAGAVRRPISYLIGEEPESESEVWHTPNGAGEPIDKGDADVLLVSGPSIRFRTNVQSVKLPSGASMDDEPARNGEALVYVLSGSVRAEIGARSFPLRKGDALHFLTDRAASWTNTGRGAAELLHVSAPQA